jgi:LPS O-antigen subunit length determinant protein (WzzB/FepE family)
MQKALMLKNREDLKAIIDNPTMNIKLSRDAVVYLPSIDLYSLRERYNRINAMIEKMERVQLVSLAWKTELPVVPFKPNKSMSILIGLVMGIILGIFTAFFMGWVENTEYSHAGRSIG